MYRHLILILFVVFAGSWMVTTAAEAQSPAVNGHHARDDLLSMVDRLQALRGIPQLDGAAKDALVDVRSELLALDDAELGDLELLAPQIAEMQSALRVLGAVNNLAVKRQLAAADMLKSSNPDPFPDAAYPDLLDDIQDTVDVVASTFNLDFGGCCEVKLLVQALSDVTGIDVETALDVFTFGGFSAACDASCPSQGDKPSANDSENTNSIGQLGNCNAVNRSSTLEAYSTRVAFIVAEAARDVASRICSQEIGGVVVGGNLSVACIPMDLIYIVAKGLHDNLALCDTFIDEAEIEGSYDRLGHLHADLESAQSSVDDLDADLAAHDTALADHHTRISDQMDANTAIITGTIGDAETAILGAIDLHDTEINAALDTHDADLKAQLAAHDDAMKRLLADTRAFFTQLEVEEALLAREREAIYYLPAADGGHLGLAREIVAVTIDRIESAGESVRDARGLLAVADDLIVAGRYKRAFDGLSSAYFEAIRLPGENLSSVNSRP